MSMKTDQVFLGGTAGKSSDRPTPCRSLPAKVARLGMRQLSVSLSDESSQTLEALRLRFGARSWGEVVRRLIDEAQSPATGANGTAE